MTSGTESDDSGTAKSNNKVVRFNKVAEVIHILFMLKITLFIKIHFKRTKLLGQGRLHGWDE
jgi:hypothetical protein